MHGHTLITYYIFVILLLLTFCLDYCSYCLLATNFSVILVLFLKGKVSIVAKPGVKLEIPDGAVLENKVKS
jgi:hypothetical protein